MSAISKRMEEAAGLLDRALNVALVAVALVAAMAYVVVLFAAFTVDVSHTGDGFRFGDGSRRGGDIIVLPAQPF